MFSIGCMLYYIARIQTPKITEVELSAKAPVCQ